MPSDKGKLQRVIAPIVGSLAVVAIGTVLYRRGSLDFGAYRAALSALPLSAFLTSLAAQLGVLVCSAWRVWLCLPRPRGIAFGRALEAIAGGQSMNVVAPARAGDVMKAWLLGRASGDRVPVLVAGGAVVADKVLDLVCVAIMTLLGGVSLLPGFFASLPRWALVGTPLTFVVMVTAYRVWGTQRNLVARWLDSFQAGFEGLRDVRIVALGIGAGVATWIGEATALSVIVGAAGFPLSLGSGVLALATLYLGIAVPVSVANVGTFEAALALGLQQAGVPFETALAAATLHHAGQLAATFGLWAILAATRKISGRRGSTSI